MGWRRNLAQRVAGRVQRAMERSLEVRPDTPIGRSFASFGEGSRIAWPRVRLVGAHAMRVGAGVTMLPYGCLEAYAPQGSVVLDIGDGCFFGHHVRIVALNGVRVGRDSAFGQFVTLADTVHDYKRSAGTSWRAPLRVGEPLIVGAGVWVGVGAVIVGGLTIGEGSIVGPNTVITADVPPGVLVSGDPARIVRRRHPESGVWTALDDPPRLGSG